jgi:biopolymer transport protein ExbB
MRASLRVVALVAGALAAPALADALAEPPAQTLDQLLDRVQAGVASQEAEDAKREAEFRAAKDRQAAMLADVRARRAAAEAKSTELERVFDENEVKIPELQEQLRQRMGTLGELFGVVRQVSGDMLGYVDDSVVSAQIPGRKEFLLDLSKKKDLPGVKDLEHLWFTIQQEMTESGKLVRFEAPVIGADGQQREQPVIRIGTFNVVSGGKYLVFKNDKLVELPTQPAGRYLRTIARYGTAKSGDTAVAIDPSRGNILSLLIQSPTFRERVDQGGLVGYVTLVLGAAGLLLALWRLASLGTVGRRMRAQLVTAGARRDNPLGRVLAVYEDNRDVDVETLELKLDEAILRETPSLERGNTLIKVLSAVAPLLGLLGTVTGMIQVFQQITLFGTGDPRIMAGGISQALVTTVIGLCVAIPLLLLHSIVSSRSKSLVQILDEQSSGLVASHADPHGGSLGGALAG